MVGVVLAPEVNLEPGLIHVLHIAFSNIYSRKETVYTVYQEARSDNTVFERHLSFYNVHGIETPISSVWASLYTGTDSLGSY
jgi:hypothetical protein